MSSLLRKALNPTVLASLPVLVWVHDSFYGLVRVRQGESFWQDELWLVRKSEGLWLSALLRILRSQEIDPEREVERQRLAEFEKDHCNATSTSRLIIKPPVPTTGDFVVVRDPSVYGSSRWLVRRVVGLGGQVVVLPAEKWEHPSSTNMRLPDDEGNQSALRIATASVPPYSMWVESLPAETNRMNGSISKKMLVGIAEYRLWPPTRVGWFRKEPSAPIYGHRNGYSYWP